MSTLPRFCYSSLKSMLNLTVPLISVDYNRHNTCAFPSPTSMPFLSLQVPRMKPRSLFSQTSSQQAGMVLHSQILSPANL